MENVTQKALARAAHLLTAALVLIALPAMADPAVWPAPGAPLTDARLESPKPRRPWRVFLDAGHGAPGNTGNRSVTCEDEEAHTLRVALAVARSLEATGRVRVRLSRTGAQRPRYQDRLAAATAFRADAIVSIHSDARGDAHAWEPTPGTSCLRNDAEPGLGVLVSDEGPKYLATARAGLAASLAKHLSAAGFPLYGGEDWMTLYARGAAPGVFLDRRPRRQRVYFLRKPRIPSVIVETHHALDQEENARWLEPRTLDAFGAAVAVALDEALRKK